MKTKLHFIIASLILLFMAGGQSICLAAEDWHWRDGGDNDQPNKKFSGGKGTQSDPYLISSCQDMADLAYLINTGNDFTAKYFRQTCDLVFNDDLIVNGEYNKEKEGTFKKYISPGNSGVIDDEFEGYFDGGGYTMKGLYLYSVRKEEVVSGLFGYVEKGEIRNVNLDEVYVSILNYENRNHYYCGIIAGLAENCRITNCHVTNAYVSQQQIESRVYAYCGGVVGSAKEVTISNCSFEGIIFGDGNSSLGGIVGHLEGGTIKGCKMIGSIIVNTNYKAQDIGGICSKATKATISDCISDANISMNFRLVYDIGNIDAKLPCDKAYIGGLVAYAEDCNFTRCASLGEITTNGNNGSQIYVVAVTGIATVNGKTLLSDCVRYGTITKNSIFSSGIVYGRGFEYDGFAYSYDSELTIRRCLSYNIFNTYGLEARYNKFITGSGKCVEDDDNYYWGIENNKGSDYQEEYPGDPDEEDPDEEEPGEGNPIEKEELLEKTSDFGKESPEGLSYFKTTQLAHLQGISNIWGIYDCADNELKGLPLPKSCGGMATLYSGKGTEAEPYVIDYEIDLKALSESVNNGNNMEGKYFRLNADIYGGNISSIGESSDKPFKGHFDGNGYAIIGLRRCLFGYMYGTVKNLTLLNCDVKCRSVGAALALYVGDSEGSANGEISNCYVSGIVNVDRRWDDGTNTISGLCNRVSEGSKVHDCYFKGTLNLSNIFFGGTYMAAGIAASNRSDNGIYNCYASFDVRQSGGFIGGDDVYGITFSGGISNCFAIVSGAKDYSGCTLLNAEAELSASALGDQWLQGLYHPVLKGTKYYEVTTPEGDITYLDGIPAEVAVEEGEIANAARRANASGTDENGDALKSNYITCYVPKSEEELHDVILWSLPNVAIYSAEDKMDVIPNFYLDNREDLQYTPTPCATKAMGAMYYPLQPNSTGWHMLCLPGYVTKDLFPESSRLFVVDGVDNAAMTVLVSEVDTISPATPFIAYIPLEAEDVSLVSFGDLVFTPRTASATSPLMGTFANTTQSDCATELSADGKTLLHSIVCDIKPFQAWLPGVKGDMAISSTPTGINLIGRDSDGNERIYNLRGIEMKSEKGIYIKGGKLRIKN